MASGDTLCFFSPLANEPPAANFATPDLRNGHPVLDFDSTVDEEAVFTGVLPSGYAGGGLTVLCRWLFTSATSGTISVQAAIETMQGGGHDLDADDFAAFQAGSATANATSGVISTSTITFTNGAQMDNLAAGGAFRLKIRRDADDTVGTDNAAGDAELLGISISES